LWSTPLANKMINLVYIKAAIEANTGLRLRLKQVAKYLVEERLCTPEQANRALYFSYESFSTGDKIAKPLDNPLPVDKEIGKWEAIKEDQDE